MLRSASRKLFASHAFVGPLSTVSSRASSTLPTHDSSGRKIVDVTLIPGDGIGPEIGDAVVRIFAAADVPIRWEQHNVSTKSVTSTSLISNDCLESIKRNKVALKGPLATPIGAGHVSLNITLRKELNLFANVRPCKSLPGVKTRYDNVDLVTVRENTEGLYRGIEHQILPDVVQTIRMITEPACLRTARHAFEYAVRNNRKKVTCVHKGNVMKLGDGLFMKSCKAVAKEYPQIEFDDMFIDNCARQLVSDPTTLDVMVTENLFGDIISDLCAGLIGGLGLTPSGNIGPEAAVFEAVHGTAPDIAGQNKANPTALLLSSVMMLRHLGMYDKADMIEKAVFSVIQEQKNVTGDLGGSATCTQFTQAIINNLH
eukprot:TRINITY_DN566_c0_g1_i1.p1 TRINITY_DN566_c0_g1~~TRINITY_DN566_c0_g1_i1.p1  ORF type:complete len:371 (+),score=88.33 TRINITY_DN566_c0_g1_i1:69-1181(+)